MKPTSKMPTPLRTTHHTTKSVSDLQEQIRRRAYELYERRGGVEGHELEDWLQAESELTQPEAQAIAA
jgi:Protein of unknown function (DUF2934)